MPRTFLLGLLFLLPVLSTRLESIIHSELCTVMVCVWVPPQASRCHGGGWIVCDWFVSSAGIGGANEAPARRPREPAYSTKERRRQFPSFALFALVSSAVMNGCPSATPLCPGASWVQTDTSKNCKLHKPFPASLQACSILSQWEKVFKTTSFKPFLCK